MDATCARVSDYSVPVDDNGTGRFTVPGCQGGCHFCEHASNRIHEERRVTVRNRRISDLNIRLTLEQRNGELRYGMKILRC